MAGDQGRKRLGEILIEQNSITRDQLKKALEEQKGTDALLGEMLIKLKFLSEEDIVIALATQFNFPYLPIDNFEVNSHAVRSVPVELVKKYLFMPIDKIKSILTVVMADPANEEAIHEIEQASSCRVQAFVATVTEIKKSIKRHYKIDVGIDSTAGDHVSKVSFQQAKDQP